MFQRNPSKVFQAKTGQSTGYFLWKKIDGALIIRKRKPSNTFTPATFCLMVFCLKVSGNQILVLIYVPR